jgi:hypothetical protein
VGMQPTELPTNGSAIGFVIPVAELASVWPPPVSPPAAPEPAARR